MQVGALRARLALLALVLAVLGSGSWPAALSRAQAQACQPRPPVNLTTVDAGEGRLSVTVTAGAGAIQALRFEQLDNVRVDVGGRVNQIAPFVYSPPGGTTRLTFTLHRQAPGSATLRRLVVVDGCGDWPTFVGAGTGTWLPPATPQPAPIATATATPTPTVTATVAPTAPVAAIEWWPSALAPHVLIGTTAQQRLTFTALEPLQNADVLVSPNLQPFLSVDSSPFQAAQSEAVPLFLTFSAPSSTPPQTVQGAIAIRRQGVPVSPSLSIALTIAQPSASAVDEGPTLAATDRIVVPPDGSAPYVRDQLSVIVAAGTSEQRVAQIVAGVGGVLVGKDTAGDAYQIRVSGDLSSALATIQSAPDVRSVTRTYLHRPSVSPTEWTSGDPAAYEGFQTVDLPSAWELTTGLPSLKVAVVDVGVDQWSLRWGHNGLLSGPAPIVVWEPSPAGLYREHGVWVGGIIGAFPNDPPSGTSGSGRGMAGVLWERTLLLYGAGRATFDPGIGQVVVTLDDDQTLYQFRRAVAHGSRVVNYSAGALYPTAQDASAGAANYREMIRATLANHDPTLFVFAAGNEGADARRAAPANLSAEPNVLTVAATTRDGSRLVEATDTGGHWASNWGPAVSVAAPGLNVLTTTPYCLGPGCSGQKYAVVGGTSFAAPLVSGVAGLVFDYARRLDVEITASQVKSCIVNGSKDASDVHPPVVGPDSVEIPVLNARRAVEFVKPPVLGTVTDAYTGAPVAGATVTVVSFSDPPVVVTTDSQGRYSARGIFPRVQAVSASAAGYLLESTSTTVPPCQSTQVNLALTPTPERIRRVSVASDGAQANGESGRRPALSGDGRYIAFRSAATNLVAGDANNRDDVFVKDRYTGAVERIPVATSSLEPNSRKELAIDGNGRYVAFLSPATNLVPGDTNGLDDVFVKDRQAGTIERVSVAADGTQANGLSTMLELSEDGRYVVFVSAASNLVPGDTNGFEDVFVKDRQTGAVERVSVAADGAQTNWHSTSPTLSADGRYVAFVSASSNLVAGDTNGFEDVFVKDRQTGAVERVNVSSANAQANHVSSRTALSADGRYVLFESVASNLVPGDTNDLTDVFVKDRQTGAVERVNVASDGTQANDGGVFQTTYGPALSLDGRYVAFSAAATNLVAGDTNGASDVFVKDRQTGAVERVSVAADGAQAPTGGFLPALSRDGRYVAFGSRSTNLVPADTNGLADIFVVDRSVPAAP